MAVLETTFNVRVHGDFVRKALRPSIITIPRFVLIPLSDALQLKSQGANIAFSRQKDIVQVPILVNQVRRELAMIDNLRIGQRLYHGLLVIKQIRPGRLVIGQNPLFRAFPENTVLTSADNLADKDTLITHGTPHESIRELVEGDFNTVLKFLSQDQPSEVAEKVLAGKPITIDDQTNNAIKELLLYYCQILNNEEAAKAVLAAPDLSTAYSSGFLAKMPAEFVMEIAKIISEASRDKIIKTIRGSNLVENVKDPLLAVLSEREGICVPMFSFTSPIFAAALVASHLRGASVKILLDRVESNQRGSQFSNLVQYNEREGFDVRIFTTSSQHQKNILCKGQGIFILGSQNLTGRAFSSNLEDIIIVRNDPKNYKLKQDEFDKLFSRSGDYVPLPAEILDHPFLQRTGLTGIRFKERVAPPHEISELFRLFTVMRPADFKTLRTIQQMVKGMKAEMVFDRSQPFRPFFTEINDPFILHLLHDFMEKVPECFSFEPASQSGKYHPGVTSGISGLVEHTMIVIELAIKLCKFLGREDLINDLVLLGFGHDAFKDCHRMENGTIIQGHYNHEHGRLCAEELWKVFKLQDGWEKYVSCIEEGTKAAAEHMGAYAKPEPKPLLASDSMAKRILMLADMLASRKYLYVSHRASQPMKPEEILDLMLNNSLSVRGEAFDNIADDPELMRFIQESTGLFGNVINKYQDVPKRAQKMLRVAESLYDILGMSAEQDPKRLETLVSAMLFATFRYKNGFEITSPEAKAAFDEVMQKLARKYQDPNTKAGRIVENLRKAGLAIKKSSQARLKEQDDHALWVIAVANCMLVDNDTWIIIEDEVNAHLSKTNIPAHDWQRQKYDQAELARMEQQIQNLALTQYLEEILPEYEKAVLQRMNFRKRVNLAKNVDRSVLIEQIKKSGIFNIMARLLINQPPETMNAARDRQGLNQFDFFPQISQAVEKILEKVRNNEKIMIYGDFDVDGMTSVAILITILRWIKRKQVYNDLISRGIRQDEAANQAQAQAMESIGYYIPHREKEGYGLNEKALQHIQRLGYKLVITVDCGITNADLVEQFSKQGLEFVITDHHSQNGPIPKTCVMINPKIDLSPGHPAYDLPGAGVTHKLALAIAQKQGIDFKDTFRDLVACAVISDLVKMSGQNRAYVRFGLKRLSLPGGRKNKGLVELVRRDGKSRIDERVVLETIRPQLNVLGQTGDALMGVKLLTEFQDRVIAEMAGVAYERREEQKDGDELLLEDAISKVKDQLNQAGLAAFSNWPKSNSGYIAALLLKEYGLPAAVMCGNQDTDKYAKGSIRCSSSINPIRLLAECEKRFRGKLFFKFGGHEKGAAAFVIEFDKIDAFTQIYHQVAKEFTQGAREPITVTADFKEGSISLEEFKMMQALIGPFGPGFPEPILYVPAQVTYWEVYGKRRQHIKGRLINGTTFIIKNGNKRWVIKLLTQNSGKVKMLAKLGIDQFGKKEQLVLFVEDLKPVEKTPRLI